MGVLVVGPFHDANNGQLADKVARDESRLVQQQQQSVAIHGAGVIVREQLAMDVRGPVEQSAVAVCDRPQPREQQARVRWQRSELRVREESRL